jgi:hypothetical protein
MKLYHGTTSNALQDILANGIKPRSVLTRRKGNWKEHPSNEDMVYLSDTYAGFFAMAAAQSHGGNPLILELTFPDPLPPAVERFLCPDEDFLEQASRGGNGSHDMKTMTAFYAKKMSTLRFRRMWSMSLKHLGTVAHKGIVDPKYISRYCVIPSGKETMWLQLALSDASICLSNYRYCAHRYQMLNAALFSRVTPREEEFVAQELHILSQPDFVQQVTKVRTEAPDIYNSIVKRRDVMQKQLAKLEVVSL